jgi:hypothetical protein
MSVVYRKSLKGIDEVAFKTTGLPMRMMSYLLVVDGESSVDQLAANNRQLPSLDVVLRGLMEQGFLEVAASQANVVEMNQARVGNGAPRPAYAPAPMQAPAPTMQPPPPSYAPPPAGYFPELDSIKANMVRDVSGVLGADAAQVIQKIQGCRTKDDLFATMMGIRKIITIYADRAAADKFAARYSALSQ